MEASSKSFSTDFSQRSEDMESIREPFSFSGEITLTSSTDEADFAFA